MKKMLAVLLTLCLVLAAVSAMAEDFSGTWYLSIGSLTAGTIELSEDGVAKLDAPFMELTAEGTWEAGENEVTVTIQDEPMTFVWDGTAMSSESFPLSVTREAGKITFVQLMAYMETQELPEGVTEADMVSAMLEVMSLVASMGSDDSGDEPVKDIDAETETETPEPEAAKKPEITIVDEYFYIRKVYSGEAGLWIGRLRNDTDVPLFVTDGVLTLKDAEGNQIGETKYYHNSGSRYLEPGEISFISYRANIDEGATVAGWDISLTSAAESFYKKDRPVDVLNADLQLRVNFSDYATVTVANTGDSSLPGIKAVLVLKDADDNILDLLTEDLYMDALGPHSTLTLYSTIWSDLTEFCNANGLTLSSVDAYAWVEVN